MERTSISTWPAEIPRDYTALQKEYGTFIAYAVQRFGRVDQTPQDLLQHIWLKIISSEVLEKYVASLQSNHTVPDHVTMLEACALLGVTYQVWRSAHWSYSKIFLDVMGGHAPEGKQRGVTRLRSPKGERWVAWMPSPINPEEGGPASTKAKFKTKEVLKLAEMGVFSNVFVSLPTPVASPTHFKNYLRQAVKNHFANWVRTRKRREKERPADAFGATFAGPEGVVPFAWEELVADPNAHGQMEASADISSVMGSINADELLAHKEELTDLLGDGYTLIEAVKKLDLSAETRRSVQRALRTLG
jgi:DNA-directed RNA polymerase specialized sigma24 family protein